jgi:phosphoglucosamine mutase
MPWPVGDKIGTVEENNNAVDDYIDYLTNLFNGLDLSNIKIALDCANGATYAAGPRVMERFGADFSVIHNTPNGANINLNCGSTHREDLKEYVLANSMDVGIAFDGDGDRCLMVDDKGNMISGDQMMSICASHMKEQGRLKDNTLVVTVMSNLGLHIMGRETGINIENTAVGDRYVLERMLQIDASIGGEESGHIIFLEHNTSGDGILTALNILAIMAETGESLSALNTKMKVLPQILVNAVVKNENKYNYDKIDEIKSAIEELTKMFDGRGRVLIRASGTEPLVRVMIEGEDLNLIKSEAEKMAVMIESFLG